jgi:class 3 adenylate cyclase
VALSPDASTDAFPRAPGSFGLFLLVRGLTLLTVLLVCLVGLVWVGLRLVTPQWVPASVRVGLDTGVGPATELGVLLGMLIIGMATLAGLRRWEAHIGRVRAARYKAWAREREEALEQAREQARPRAEPTRGDVPEAVLVVDLIQSTELIRDQGDEFFRDLLRRIETAFIPVARAHGTRAVNGHGDGFLFCFERADQALEAVREMYTRLPVLNQAVTPGAEVAFRASLHMGTTFPDTRGNRTGLAVLKTVRLGSVMETLHGRGAGRNCLVVSEEALAALGARGASSKLLGRVSLRGFPGTHAVYQLDV